MALPLLQGGQVPFAGCSLLLHQRALSLAQPAAQLGQALRPGCLLLLQCLRAEQRAQSVPVLRPGSGTWLQGKVGGY